MLFLFVGCLALGSLGGGWAFAQSTGWLQQPGSHSHLVLSKKPLRQLKYQISPTSSKCGTRKWRRACDTTPPETTITAEPPATTTETNANFSFTSNESGSSFACKLDGGSWGSCSSPKAYSSLNLGEHGFSVRATDASGNIDETPANGEWTVEALPPPVIEPPKAVWTTPANAQAQVPVTLDGTASTGAAPLSCVWSFENESGSTVWQTQNGCRIEFAFESTGTKYLKLIVRNAAGETDSNKQSFDVAAAPDTTPPDTTITSSPSATTTSTSASFSFTSNESGSSFACKLDGGSWGTCSSPKAYSSLNLGEHGFSVRASDGAGNVDPSPASWTWSVLEESAPPPPDTTPPDTTITSSPPATTTETSANFSFTSSESGSSFACKLDGGSWSSCSSPKAYSSLNLGEHGFSVRATDSAGNVDSSPANRTWKVELPPPPPPSGCVSGATQATTPAQVRSAVQADANVCVVANVGDVNLEGLGSSPVTISTDGAAMGHVLLKNTTDLTIRNARFRSIEMRGAHRTKLLNNVIGGTQANRVYDQLIFMPSESNDVSIEGNDIGWTLADSSGNTGYGCRCYGVLNNFRFVGNRVHDIAADGLQGFNGSNILIDRNEIGPVGANPGSSEHSDNIQIVSNGPGMRVTNNYIHHQGYFEGSITGNSGSTYIHGGSSGSLLYENNLIETSRGETEICSLGTGGNDRSNLTIRNNTWIEGGLAFSNFPSFRYGCTGGSNNLVERNVSVDQDGGLAEEGSAATFSSNLFGKPSLVTFDAQRNCTSANCNPSSGPIGYRKPSGVSW